MCLAFHKLFFKKLHLSRSSLFPFCMFRLLKQFSTEWVVFGDFLSISNYNFNRSISPFSDMEVELSSRSLIRRLRARSTSLTFFRPLFCCSLPRTLDGLMQLFARSSFGGIFFLSCRILTSWLSLFVFILNLYSDAWRSHCPRWWWNITYSNSLSKARWYFISARFVAHAPSAHIPDKTESAWRTAK